MLVFRLHRYGFAREIFTKLRRCLLHLLVTILDQLSDFGGHGEGDLLQKIAVKARRCYADLTMGVSIDHIFFSIRHRWSPAVYLA